MNPAEWLARTAARAPRSPALYSGSRLVQDYAAFAGNAAAIGGALRDAFAISPGERIALFMPNCTQYLEVLYGAWYCGAAVVPINSRLHPREAAWILADSEARLVFTAASCAQSLAPLLAAQQCQLLDVDGSTFTNLRQSAPLPRPAELNSDAMLWLFYTSGTTGKPKGVMISSQNIQAMTSCYFIDVDTVDAGDAILYAAPMSHGAGLYNFVHVLRGARHVVPESGGFDPPEILDLARSMQSVSMFAAPTMVRRLVDRARADNCPGDGIKTIVYGGGPMYLADIIEAVDIMGPRFVQIYGQGESPMTITALSRELVADRQHPSWKARLASVGVAQSCVRVKIADARGKELPAGEIGEILVQGQATMQGYWRKPEASAETLRDGWLWTGDQGAMDLDGFVTLHDRSRDVIISGGSNIYPREVEEALLLHPSVHEVAVIGRAHPDWGEEVVAFVVPAAGCTIDAGQLDAHCLEHFARFKRPKDYFPLDELPKNNYGKVLKTSLRESIRG